MDVQPSNQSVEKLFSGTVYHIDFYQRDYKWNEVPVRRLLDDVFYPFTKTYAENQDLDPTQETITAKYPWYYLNTYVTNTVSGKVFVVDGQQRLTTLTLILIKLKHLAKSYDSKTDNWLSNKVVGYSGMEASYWMHHEKHLSTLESLFNDDSDLKSIDISSGITAKNMVVNYQVISKVLDTKLFDKKVFETFVHYFLLRLVIINLSVEQTDVPMVFEVINDRGVKLKPYEILKGKLLGQIDKVELQQYDFNALWESNVKAINACSEDEADNFFRYFLKAQFASTRAQAQEFDGDYHRTMFSPSMEAKLGLEHNAVNVKNFLNKEFRYYSALYLKYWQAKTTYKSDYKNVYYNEMNDLQSQCILILAACRVDDPEENLKIDLVARELDRLFTLSQLQGGYDSNRFAVEIYTIAAKLLSAPMDDYRTIFDESLTKMLADQREDEVSDPFRYAFFKNASLSSLNKRFIRYFFTRIESFVADGMRQDMRHSFKDLVLKTGSVNGFHVEHILSRNSENLAHFNDDEELFEQQRNRLGGILLLKGKDNISSNNEVYEQKLKSYANTLYWNETLREDTYKSKLDFKNFIQSKELSFQAYNQFGEDELEARHKLLFEISRLIWM
ncbi:MAG: hypothetical protein ACJAWI_000371 [Marinomonas primoryensis]|jgi:uncharacterized protein with ParB-like and HNH nuclease domain